MKQTFQQHLIPTDKPSRLYLRLNGKKLTFYGVALPNSKYLPNQTILVLPNQTIVVTSDEEPKEGDYNIYNWCTDTGDDNWLIGECVVKNKQLYHYLKDGVLRDREMHYWMPIGLGTKKIIASNDKDLTPDRLIPDHWIEHTAKKFNAGEPIKTIELEMEYVCDRCKNEDCIVAVKNGRAKDCKSYERLKTENGFVIVAEKEEKTLTERTLRKEFSRKDVDKLMNELLNGIFCKHNRIPIIDSNTISNFVTEFLNTKP